MVPVENWLIGGLGWQNALFVLGCAGAGHRAAGLGLREPAQAAQHRAAAERGAALREAFAYPSFRC
jgi:hypothetical protein